MLCIYLPIEDTVGTNHENRKTQGISVGEAMKELLVSPPPHIKARTTSNLIMLYVILCLLPTTCWGIYVFGLHALEIILVSIVSAVLSECVGCRLIKKEPGLSAVVTGLLLALCLPPSVPLWVPAVGSVFAIFVGKIAFGGTGNNIFNPALVGRAFLMLSWPALLAPPVWPVPLESTSSATPLNLWKHQHVSTSLHDLFWGFRPGCIGEISAFAILLGGAVLLVLRIIDWRIPASYLGTVALLSWLLGEPVLFHLLAGGLLLGAFFMATDYVTSPITKNGKLIFGAGAGCLLVVIRRFGSLPEGVTYSILIMNAFSPLIERITKPRVYGTKR
jgi:electron transport complex protein RnfD